jgi:hypothetical protein
MHSDYRGKNTDLHTAQEFFVEEFQRAAKNLDKLLHIRIGKARYTDTVRNLVDSLWILATELVLNASSGDATGSSNSRF